MDNSRLEYLQKVAQYGSISKAADELYITSSALSKYIKKIEEEYGVVLFDRVGKRFELTYAGERYLRWLSEIGSLYEQMETELSDIANSYTGRLKVGVQLSGAYELIDQVLPVFHAQFPGVLIELVEDTYSNLRQQLENNSLDFAILPDEGLPALIETIPLQEEQLTLVVPKASSISFNAVSREGFRYPWVDIRMLPELSYVAPFPDQGAYHAFRILEEEYGCSFRIILRTRTISRLLRCVRIGLGCTLTPDSHVLSSGYRKDVELFSVGEQPHTGNLVVAYNRSHYLNHAADVFIELCGKAVK